MDVNDRAFRWGLLAFVVVALPVMAVGGVLVFKAAAGSVGVCVLGGAGTGVFAASLGVLAAEIVFDILRDTGP